MTEAQTLAAVLAAMAAAAAWLVYCVRRELQGVRHELHLPLVRILAQGEPESLARFLEQALRRSLGRLAPQAGIAVAPEYDGSVSKAPIGRVSTLGLMVRVAAPEPVLRISIPPPSDRSDRAVPLCGPGELILAWPLDLLGEVLLAGTVLLRCLADGSARPENAAALAASARDQLWHGCPGMARDPAGPWRGEPDEDWDVPVAAPHGLDTGLTLNLLDISLRLLSERDQNLAPGETDRAARALLRAWPERAEPLARAGIEMALAARVLDGIAGADAAALWSALDLADAARSRLAELGRPRALAALERMRAQILVGLARLEREPLHLEAARDALVRAISGRPCEALPGTGDFDHDSRILDELIRMALPEDPASREPGGRPRPAG